MPHPCYKGFVHRTFFPLPLTLEFPDHPTPEDPGFSQDTAGLCTGIWGQARCPIQSCQGAPTMHGPTADHQWGWCYGSLPFEEVSRPSPTLEEDIGLLGEEMGSQEPQGLLLYKQEPQVHRTCWADYHSSYFHCTPQSSFLERRGVMGWDQSWSQQLWSVGPLLVEEG